MELLCLELCLFVDSSVLLLSCSITTGVLESPGLLASFFVTIILTMALMSFYIYTSTMQAYNLSNQLMRSGAQNIDQLQLLVLRAKCLSSMGDVENSVKHLQQALRSDPDNSSCRTQYKKMKEIHETKTEGDTHFRAGEHDEAIAAWTKAVNLMTTGIPGFSTSKIYITKIYTNRAVAWSKKGDLQKAISDCSLGIKEDPSSIKCHYRRAEFNFTLGETKEQLNQSIRDYEKVDQLQVSLSFTGVIEGNISPYCWYLVSCGVLH